MLTKPRSLPPTLYPAYTVISESGAFTVTVIEALVPLKPAANKPSFTSLVILVTLFAAAELESKLYCLWDDEKI